MMQQEENLSEMVEQLETSTTEAPPTTLPEEGTPDTDTPQEASGTEEVATTETPDETPSFDIPTMALNAWVTANRLTFENIRLHRTDIRGVDREKTMIVSDLDPDGVTNEAGDLIKELSLFTNADLFPMLNTEAVSMNIFSTNSFRVIYKIGDTRYLKSYGVKAGLIVVACEEINDLLIPYTKFKVKKKAIGINPPDCTVDISAKLTQVADIEAVHLLYPQIQRHTEGMETNLQVITWLMQRQASIRDIHHLVQLDDTAIHIINS